MITLNRRHALKLGLAGGAMLAAARPASALVKIVVSGADFQPLPIAIPDFAGSDPAFGKAVADIVRNNLSRSGLFAVIDQATLPQQVGSISTEPDFNAWRGINAHAVVMGQVENSGQIQAAVRVWDVQAGEQQVGKSYSTDPANLRRIGHIISDAIYTALTGESGYFDTRIAFIAESGPKANRLKRLAIMDQDGANVQYITQGNPETMTPRFSPTQQMLTYIALDGGDPQIYLLDLATGRPQPLGNFNSMTFSPRFSPDGRNIAFSVEGGGTTNIYAMPIGGQPQQLTSGASIDTSPSYSPDGANIAFESDRGGTSQIYIMASSGGPAQRISFAEGTYNTPVWSPKGDYIAFTKQGGGQFSIGIMKPDGSGEKLLYSGFHAEGPTWAPNGRVIMYFSDPGGDSGPSLYTVDVWGRANNKVPTKTFASDPAWSPLRG
ncbi:MAG TPA: Tol-Pal system beta propeller repeat protein TolB [Devosiaceae bacterium]|nr:Tol-Pal system beta propeller repeat protein TolB [Devosiaceae bacterium]